jgi:hypothetical protein
MQREQRALLELQRFERIAALERRIFDHAFAAFDQVERELGAPVKVKELPAADNSGEGAKAATPKRKSGKAITGEFEALDTSRAGESEESSNGHATFRRQR